MAQQPENSQSYLKPCRVIVLYFINNNIYVVLVYGVNKSILSHYPPTVVHSISLMVL